MHITVGFFRLFISSIRRLPDLIPVASNNDATAGNACDGFDQQRDLTERRSIFRSPAERIRGSHHSENWV
jgi:hypothetical protein